MSRNQRLSFLGIAAVIAVVAIVFFAAGSGPDETAEDAGTQSAQTSTPSATPDGAPEATPTPTPKPKPPLLQAGEITKLRVTEGDTVRFRARSEPEEEIHVHGYDRYIALPPGETVNVSFKADITGIFEIELHGSAEQIAQLRVDPE